MPTLPKPAIVTRVRVRVNGGRVDEDDHMHRLEVCRCVMFLSHLHQAGNSVNGRTAPYLIRVGDGSHIGAAAAPTILYDVRVSRQPSSIVVSATVGHPVSALLMEEPSRVPHHALLSMVDCRSTRSRACRLTDLAAFFSLSSLFCFASLCFSSLSLWW
jgi:hypothetical protein